MPRTKLPVSPHGGSPDETEAMFYEALQKGDVDLLMSCWAEDDEIVCVHPGGSRLMGAAAIRAAFEGMFAQGSIRVTISQVHRVQSVSSAVHNVAERVEIMLPDGLHAAFLIATNVYHRTLEGWRLVAHHASTGGSPEGISGTETASPQSDTPQAVSGASQPRWLRLSNGKQVDLRDWKVVLFMQGHCPYCHKFDPVLKQLAGQYGFSVFSYTIDGQGDDAFPEALPAPPDVMQTFFPNIPVATPTTALSSNCTSR